MNNKLSVKHHCIPQFYLNRFGTKQKNGSHQIFVYNKNNNAFFKNSVSNIGYIKNYNTIEIDSEKTDEFEKLHNQVFERKYSKRLSKIITEIELVFKKRLCINCLSNNELEKLNDIVLLSVEHKYFLSIMLAYFIKRSKKTRYFEKTMYNKMYNMMEQIYNGMNLDKNKFEQNVFEELGTKEQLKIANIVSCFKEDEIKELAKYFLYHTWNVGYNCSRHLIYTSDSVHGLTTTWKEKPAWMGVGYGSPGSLIIFPITPYICILMYDTLLLEKKKKFVVDRNYVYLDEELVRFINEEIVFSAVDEVYSIDGDWKHLKDFYKKEKLPIGHKPYSVK